MWKTLASLWVTIGLGLETINSATRTINNLVTTAEEHSASFKATSMDELRAKQAKAKAKADNKIAAING
jgi:hypothetical protein